MDTEVLKNLAITDQATQNMIEHVQNCIVVYEQTLKAMGVYPPDTVSQAVDNSQLSYVPRKDAEGPYVNIPDSY
jgi:hypothetical protein